MENIEIKKYFDELNFLNFILNNEKITINEDDIHLLENSLISALIYANKNLMRFMDLNTYNYLLKNLWLHYAIIDNILDIDSSKYDVAGNGLIVTSVSSAGASTSVSSNKSLDNGNMLTLDLFRTPYGRKAYTILESISNSAIIL